MNIPSKIKVGSCDYSVVHPYKFRDIGYCGICDYIALEIRLSDTNSDGDLVKDQAKLKTLMHEVIHAIDHASSLGVFCDEDGKPDEAKVDGWAEWLCMVLRDNPDFTRMFLED